MGTEDDARHVGEVKDIYYFVAYLQRSDGYLYNVNVLLHNVHPVTWVAGMSKETVVLWFAEIPADMACSSGFPVIEPDVTP